MSHGLLSKETNSYHKSSDFHKNSLQIEKIQMTMVSWDYSSSVRIQSTREEIIPNTVFLLF